MAAINTYEIGDLVKCTGTFTNAAGTAVDPDVVRFKFLLGSTVTTYLYGTDSELVKSSTGVYYVEIEADAAGTYYYRFEGETSAGANQGAFETYFKTNVSAF